MITPSAIIPGSATAICFFDLFYFATCVNVAEAAGEIDPVYSFLKLTSGIPRDGARVIPGDDHYCCSKTDQDIGVVADDAAGARNVAARTIGLSCRTSCTATKQKENN